MITRCFAIFDRKAGLYSTPFFAAAPGLAIRMATDAVNDPSTTLNRYPGDFDLYEVGAFDDNSGEFIPTRPQHLCSLVSLIHQSRQNEMPLGETQQ